MFQQDLHRSPTRSFLSAMCGGHPPAHAVRPARRPALKAWVAGLISLRVALLVAVVLFEMPVGQALLAGTEGAAFGFFPILWIVINAIWVYNLTVDVRALRRAAPVVREGQPRPADPGDHHRVLLRRAARGAGRLRHPGRDHRGDADGARLPADQGRGRRADRQHRTGRVRRAGHPDRHAGRGLLRRQQRPGAHRRHARRDGRPADPDPRRGRARWSWCSSSTASAACRQTWLPALVCGVAFGLAQFVAANYISVPLADIVAALVSAGCRRRCCCGSGSPAEVLSPTAEPRSDRAHRRPPRRRRRRDGRRPARRTRGASAGRDRRRDRSTTAGPTSRRPTRRTS